MLRRLRRRLIRRLAEEAFWAGWEEGAVAYTSLLASSITHEGEA